MKLTFHSVIAGLLLALGAPVSVRAKPAEKAAPASAAQLERIREKNVRKAREKMAADRREYRGDDFSALEQLYQKGNANPRTPENQEFLKQVVEKYPKSNRAGCAALYLGRYTRGDGQEKYLRLAIEKHSDCYYGDGTSVGGYARFILGMMDQNAGKQSAAKKHFEEIRKNYAESTDHGGRLIVENLPE